MRFRAVLVDDEPLALARLERLLERHRGAVEIVGKADDGAAAVAMINDLRPDVVFLDVKMPELDGFEVLERLDYTPSVIFSTAYDRYALRAFDVHSVDYLVKPVDAARLELALDKLRRLADGGAADLQKRVRRALDELGRRPRKSRIQVKTGDRIRLVPFSEVAFFRARDKYVEVHSRGESYLITDSLTKLEGELPPGDFARVHRSAIVNITFIDEIVRTLAGAWEVRLRDRAGTRLPVSRRYKSRLDLG